MENYTQIQSVEAIPSCVECGQDMYHEVYKTPLCSCCRQKFIKYPIPLSVKIFGTVIAVTALFSLYSLSQNIKSGSSFQKGQWASIHQNNGTAALDMNRSIKIGTPEKIN